MKDQNILLIREVSILNSDFLSVYGNTIVEYAQDQEDGIAADISDILPRGK